MATVKKSDEINQLLDRHFLIENRRGKFRAFFLFLL